MHGENLVERIGRRDGRRGGDAQRKFGGEDWTQRCAEGQRAQRNSTSPRRPSSTPYVGCWMVGEKFKVFKVFKMLKVFKFL